MRGKLYDYPLSQKCNSFLTHVDTYTHTHLRRHTKIHTHTQTHTHTYAHVCSPCGCSAGTPLPSWWNTPITATNRLAVAAEVVLVLLVVVVEARGERMRRGEMRMVSTLLRLRSGEWGVPGGLSSASVSEGVSRRWCVASPAEVRRRVSRQRVRYGGSVSPSPSPSLCSPPAPTRARNAWR
jgi:hypothetical protein